ncbi:MAG: lipocalin family protein [Xanthomarina sp.]
MKALKFLSILIVIFLTLNCSSDDDVSVSEQKSPTQQLLMSGKWYLTSVSGQTRNNCEKQSYYHFKTEDSLIQEYIKTNAVDECVTDGTYSLNYLLLNNDSELLTREGSSSLIYQIDSISDSQLILKLDEGSLSRGFRILTFEK